MFRNFSSFYSLSLLCLIIFSAPVLAAETAPVLETPKVDIYMAKLDKKFDKGALNFAAGWTEIIRQPMQEWKSEEKKNKALKLTKGIGHGVSFAVVDMLGGFLNAMTAPFPQFEIPLPENGVQGKDITGGEPAGYIPVPGEEANSRY